MRRGIAALILGSMLAIGPAGAAIAERLGPVRFATFNASLNRATAGALATELEAAVGGTVTPQVAAVLEIITINDADVLLVNEFDFDPVAAELFAELTGYPFQFVAASNTGIPSGFDRDNDGTISGGNDAFGFGLFPGQFGMLVLSRYPINTNRVRTFQGFL